MSDDVHHKRLVLGAIKSGKSGRGASARVARVKEEELHAYYYADHVLTISEGDRRDAQEMLILMTGMTIW